MHMKEEIIKFKEEEFNLKSALYLKGLIASLLSKNEHITIGLSGGSTPLPILTCLAKQSLAWERCYFFLVDERCVSLNDDASNFKQLHTSFLSHITTENCYPLFDTNAKSKDFIEKYHKEISMRCQISEGIPIFDLILLGMGKDGHIASLFPRQPELDEKEKWYLQTKNKHQGNYRITMTFPLIWKASNVIIMFKGEEKSNVYSNPIKKNPLPIHRVINNRRNTKTLCA